jgi:hypothetical protein
VIDLKVNAVLPVALWAWETLPASRSRSAPPTAWETLVASLTPKVIDLKVNAVLPVALWAWDTSSTS